MEQASLPRATVLQPDDLRGPAGLLEAVYIPATGATLATGVTAATAITPHAVIVSHPHPLFGGSMHNKVVYHAAKAFSAAGLPVLRFNFRGVGLSAGTHDHGRGEGEDLLAAMAWLRARTGLPLLLAGFSFGSWVSLRVASNDHPSARPADTGDVRGVVALGLPVRAGDRNYSYPFLGELRLPKLFVSGAADEFAPLAQLESVIATAASPVEHRWVADADHFFARPAAGAHPAGRSSTGLTEMQEAITGWLEKHFVRSQEDGVDARETGVEAWF